MEGIVLLLLKYLDRVLQSLQITLHLASIALVLHYVLLCTLYVHELPLEALDQYLEFLLERPKMVHLFLEFRAHLLSIFMQLIDNHLLLFQLFMLCIVLLQ